MDDLEDKGLLVPDCAATSSATASSSSPTATPRPSEIGPDLDLAALLGGGRLAMALVDSVPAGVYGSEALTSLGLWDAVAPPVAQAENVRAALALVASGEAPFGIVYGSDASRRRPATASPWSAPSPPDSHAPSSTPPPWSPAARRRPPRDFLDHLASPEARAIFEAQGFTVLR